MARTRGTWSFHCGSAVTNPSTIHEDMCSIPRPSQQVRDRTQLWLWYRPAAVARILRLAWVPPYVAGGAVKSQKIKKKNTENKDPISWGSGRLPRSYIDPEMLRDEREAWLTARQDANMDGAVMEARCWQTSSAKGHLENIFSRAHPICHHHSTLPLQTSHKQEGNTWWPCSNGALFIDTEI